MKYFAILIFCSTIAFAGSHNLILKFSAPVNPVNALSDLDVTSWSQLNSKPIYKVTISSSMSRSDVVDAVLSAMDVTAVEDNQQSGVVTLESASSVKSRTMTYDEISGEAIVGSTSSGGGDVNTRWIFFIDGADERKAVYNQYHMTDVRAHYAWDYADGAGVTVAVLDTGVDMTHPLYANHLVAGYDFVDNDTDPSEVEQGLDTNNNGKIDDGFGHGSHVAGIVHTIAPGANIMPVRVADSDGHAELFSIIQGIEYAVRNGAQVINMSMSIQEPSQMLIDWINYARQAGVVVVTSAGNDNSNQLLFPATESEVLTVTAVDHNFKKSAYANYGQRVDVAAPGDYIISAMPGGDYVARSGTSMAAPIVAGQAAIIFELVPDASVQYVHHRVVNKVRDISYANPGFNNKMGKGMADVWDSITLQSQQ